ncbi:MAG: phosphoglycerate kinase [Candidatus Harrisonbacteria bacterium]|nr:phosphoglycerate kinase [Candidatus Harrisonbacteria bacterium]
MKLLSDLSQESLLGKRVLTRINLDIKQAGDAYRLEAALPTLRYILEAGGKPVLLSHRGRPLKKDKKLSLEPFIGELQTKLGESIDWLENLRFDEREMTGDLEYAESLASRGDLYVNDDFATSHRAHASIVGITNFLPSYAGLHLAEEVRILSEARDNPKTPLVVILGGIKVEDKVGVIEHLLPKAKAILMGSAYHKADHPALLHDSVLLPLDEVRNNDGESRDIGKKTIALYKKALEGAATIIWAGPLGEVEKKKFATGSREIMAAIVESDAFSIVGGGDTTAFLMKENTLKKFSFVSTGGGAMLAFMAGAELPGLKALQK